MNITVTVTGAAELVQRIQGVRDSLKRSLGAAVADAGAVVMDRAKEIVPVDTGRLRDSINMDTSQTETSATATISPHTDYAAFIEFGTYKMAAQPFMRPAFDETQGDARDKMAEALMLAIQEVTT